VFAAVLFIAAVRVSALDFLAEGEKQLSINEPVKALTYLEAAVAQGEPSERLLMDLGLAYQKVGQVADAKKSFQQGALLEGPAKKTFLLNWGISNYISQDWSGAEEAFTGALTVDPTYPEALLNRANTRLNTKNWPGAAEDFRAYQAAAPANPQKAKIDQILALLDQAVLDAQAAQLAEETRQKKEAAEKQAAAEAAAAEVKKAEEAAAAEKQKQEAILAKIRESLAGASDDSKTLSTGPSGVKSNDGDFSLDP